jgi:uncharacterized protein YcfL
MLKNGIIIAFFLLLLVGCQSNNEENHSYHDTNVSAIEVHLTVNPENPALHEKVTFQAHVSQGGENVEDANEVTFEVWMSGQDDHEMIEAKHEGDGLYVATKQLDEAGTYFVVSHVTARDMHTMPKKEFNVRTK